MNFANLASRIGLAVTLCALILTPVARPVRAQEPATAPSQPSARGAAVFKIPKGYMGTDKSPLGPMLMLHPKKPAAMFVSYPKQGETTEAMRQRVHALAASMFFHEQSKEVKWEEKQLPPHPGDGDGKAVAATATQGEMEVQVVIYERTTGVRPFLYGYFGMRHKSGKGDNAKFIDEQGKGVKEFDELRKTFPN